MHEAPVKGAEGLKIFPPTGSYRYSYNSVETAISRNARTLKDICPRSFYTHIGVVAKDSSRSLISVSLVSRSDVSDEDVLSPMTLEELLENKCGGCFNCEKEDCGRCASCVLNPQIQVCIQKVS